MTYRKLLREAALFLGEKGVPDPEADAWFLMEEAFQIGRDRYFACMNDPVPEEKAVKYREMLEIRGRRIPLQHILGYQEFMGYPFRVNRDVLIPRQDTETLVLEALRLLKTLPEDTEDGETCRILDLCTGSGCIGISVKLLAQHAHVTGSDLYEGALRTAEENASALGADIKLVRSDLFEKIPDRFHMILSNPPYIKEEEISSLQPEVSLYDPRSALDGGPDGLFFYRRIIKEAPAHLYEGGWLLLEIGSDQADAVTALLRESGFREIFVRRDMAGNDRVAGALTGGTDAGRRDRYI